MGSNGFIHGHNFRGRPTPTYTAWHLMIQRCENPKNPNYHNYGERGISVCKRWRGSFPNFLADMGECPKGLTIERIDNDGNYEPNNCRWASRAEQNSNKRNIVWLELNGERHPRAIWAKKIGIGLRTLRSRIARGWSVEKALTHPLRT